MSLRSLYLPLLLLIATGCSSSGVQGGDFGVAPSLNPGFPESTFEGIVHSSADFGKSEIVLGTDMLEEERIVAIDLRLNLIGVGQETAQILASKSRMNMRLYLPDGTCLPSISVEDAIEEFSSTRGAKIKAESFQGGALSVDPIGGYVFFALVPESALEINGRTVRHLRHGIVREMDISKSLLCFELEVDSLPQPFFVGLQR